MNHKQCEKCGESGVSRQMTVSNHSEELILCDFHWHEFCLEERNSLEKFFDSVEDRFYSQSD